MANRIFPIPVVILLSLVALMGTISNLMIISAVCISKQLQVRGNVFIINLALADLIIVLGIMPLGIGLSQFEDRALEGALCDINAFLIATSTGVSTQTLMLIALERYTNICKADWYERLFSPCLIGVYVAVVWIYSAVWSAQGWTGWSRYIWGKDINLCIFDGSYSLSYNVCLTIFGMLIPMAVLAFCYLQIFRMVHSSRAKLRIYRQTSACTEQSLKQEERKLKKEVRLVLTLFTIVVLFVLFWIPASIVLVISALWSEMPSLFYSISVWMALCNSSVNGIVYGVMNKNFRNGYRRILRQLCFCCHTWCQEQVSGSDSNEQADSQGQAQSNSNDTTSSYTSGRGSTSSKVSPLGGAGIHRHSDHARQETHMPPITDNIQMDKLTTPQHSAPSGGSQMQHNAELHSEERIQTTKM